MRVSNMRMFQMMEIKSDVYEDLPSGETREIRITNPENEFDLVVAVTNVSERYAECMERFKSVNPESPVSNLLSVYRQIDKDAARQDYTICKKGCVECCSSDFEVSIFEFFYILNHLNINYSENTIREFHRMSKSDLVQLSPRCFFVDDTNGSCRIYEARPMVCRRYGVYQNACCEKILEDKQAVDNLVTASQNYSGQVNFLKRDGQVLLQRSHPLVYWFASVINDDGFKT